MRAAPAVWAALLGAMIGCAPDPGTFACTANAQCTLGDVIGRCEPEGFCSLPDAACVSGQRFDSSAGSGLAGTCVLGPADCAAWTPHYLSSCAFPSPSPALDIATGEAILDTGLGTLTSGSADLGAALGTVYIAGEPVVVMSVSELSIAAGATLRIRGQYPALLAVWGAASITGTLDADASAATNRVTSEPAACSANAAGAGTSGSDNSGGGGGGAFGGNGGAALGGSGSTGGAGATAVGAPVDVRGGCSGGAAGALGSGSAAPGGDGGRAIVIASRDTLSIAGTVSANGGGGIGASAGSSAVGGAGGGGGGAGGLIALVAPMFELGGGLYANGGGGGGAGAMGMSGGGGQAGQSTMTAASGGAEVCQSGSGAAAGGIGGVGSGSAANGGAAVTSDSCAAASAGGGGGGGSVGYILLFTSSLPAGNGQTSPPVIVSPL